MNFIEAIKLVKEGKTVYRQGWASGVQLSQSIKGPNFFVAYHVAACELPITIADVLSDDWIEGNTWDRKDI